MKGNYVEQTLIAAPCNLWSNSQAERVSQTFEQFLSRRGATHWSKIKVRVNATFTITLMRRDHEGKVFDMKSDHKSRIASN